MPTRTKDGFTIVELLIVIVVIGILAAITVVAFNGVQKRAYIATVNDAGVKISKAFAAYYVANGAFPTLSPARPCIGQIENYPAESNFAAGECGINSYAPYSSGLSDIDSTTMSQLESVAGRISVPKTKPILWVDSDAYYRGYFYSTSVSGSTISARLDWYFEGTDQSCGAAEYYSIDSGRNTMCRARVDMTR